MKRLLAILVASAVFYAVCAPNNAYAYDWQAHYANIDAIFMKEHAPKVIQAEREKMEAILPKDKVDQYMKWFEDGLNSNTGLVRIEGSERHWLELACRAGYARKELFRLGYSSGLARQAEPTE